MDLLPASGLAASIQLIAVVVPDLRPASISACRHVDRSVSGITPARCPTRLMIHNGIPINEIETYLHARAWLTDAARLLGRTPEALAAELIDTMLSSGAATIRDERLHARAEHTHVPRATLQILHPSDWR